MKKLLFSILVPTYKAKFLKECIDSVLSQTYTNFELIIVNDASPEDIDSIVSICSDDRLRYYKNKKNIGAVDVVDNWNLCLSYAVGDYVICMGDDDKLLPDCLSVYSQLIEAYPGRSIYHGWTELINEKSEVVMMQEPRPLEESVYSLIWNKWQGRRQFIGDFLYDSCELRKKGGFFKLPMAWGSDNVSAYISASDFGIINSQIPVFQYRVSPLSISSGGSYEKKILGIEGEKMWIENFLSQQPQNSIDVVYWKCIKEYYNTYYENWFVDLIFLDIRENGFSACLKWLKKRRSIQLSFSKVMRLYVKSCIF